MADRMEGKQIPRMSLDHSEGGRLELPGGLYGKWTVLYFYPKDDTPGCTKQACGYRDRLADFSEAGAQVFGVSLDDFDSHDHFKKKFSLNFPLLADTDRQLSEALGVYGDQEWRGQVYKGLSRDSFLIGPDGVIRKVWRAVDPLATIAETHAAILAAREAP